MFRHILVPIDGSLLAVETVNRAVAYAAADGARITFFHAAADYAGTDEGALMHAIAPQVFAERAAGQARTVLAKAELAARIRGVTCDSRFKVCDRPYEAILAAAAETRCDLIFMASHGRQGLARLMVGSQTLKVLAGAGVPVLVDTSEANTPRPMMTKALAVIQDEHRTLGVVLQGIQQLLREIGDARTGADFRLLRAMLYYLREFPLRLHHPKEDAYLFQRLRSRTRDADATLAELERQHHEDTALVAQLDEALARCERDPAGRLDEFAEKVDGYVTFVWNHLLLEEKAILPAARAHLNDDDWAEIGEAFGRNGDPRFDPQRGEEFRDLLSRILYRMPALEVGSTDSRRD